MHSPFDLTVPEKDWKPLYRIGAFAALLALLVFRRFLAAELTAFNGFGLLAIPDPLPNSALDWFSLFQHSPLTGMALLNVFDLINYALVGLLFLALYGALRNANRTAMQLASLLNLVGVSLYFASNQAFAMLHLSQRYAVAESEAQRQALQAAGEALLANDNLGGGIQGTGIYLSLFLVLLSGLIVALLMYRSRVFNRATAIIGLLANGLGLCYFPILLLAPQLNWLPLSLSALFRVTWYLLIAWKLLQLQRSDTPK